MADVGVLFEASKPYLVMTIVQLCLALFLSLLQSVLAHGVSATVLVVYEQLVSALLLSSLALIFDRGKRPPLSFQILSWAFFVGLLQIPLGELMLTASLRYITATFQSVALNTIPVVVFVLAVVFGRERFGFWSLNGQAKLWGILASATGATVLVVFSDPRVPDPKNSAGSQLAGGLFVGCALVGLAVLAVAVGNLLVEWVALKYPADLTLSAMMNVFGTIQTAIVAAFIERSPSSWRIRWSGSLELLAILYGGIVVTGLAYFARNWCVHKKGPVFAVAFSPLLVVFSFLLEMLVGVAQLRSIVGALLVVGGLYLLLWAKSRDFETRRIDKEGRRHSFESLNEEPLLGNAA